MSTADLLLAFEADDADALLTALRTSTAEERSSAWDEASDAFRSRRWHAEFAALDPESAKRRARTQALFCLAAGPPDVVKRVGSFVVSVPSEDEFTEMLSLRTQTWKVEFAAASLRTWAGEKEGSSGRRGGTSPRTRVRCHRWFLPSSCDRRTNREEAARCAAAPAFTAKKAAILSRM